MTGSKPCPRSFSQRPAHERQLKHHQVAAQVGESRSRELRRVIHVDHLAGQLEVVARLEVEAARRAPTSRTSSSSGPGAALGSGRFGRRPSAACSSGSTSASSRSSSLTRRRDRAHRLDLALALGWVAGRADARVGLVLLGSQALQLGQQSAPARVELDHRVEGVRGSIAAPGKRGANAVGVLPDAPEVEHPRRRRASYLAGSFDRDGDGRLGALQPGVLGEELRPRPGRCRRRRRSRA